MSQKVSEIDNFLIIYLFFGNLISLIILDEQVRIAAHNKVQSVS